MEDLEPTNNEPSFSLKDFKKWMSSQKSPTADERRKYESAGVRIESRLSLKRLVAKMSANEGDLVEMAKEFRRHGGVILETDSDNVVLVEVDSGTFYIPKFFVKKVKE